MNYNPEDILNWNKARLVRDTGFAIYDSFNYHIRWTGISRGAKEALRQWITLSRPIIDTDVTVEFQILPKPLVLIKVDAVDTEEDGCSITATYGKNYRGSWDWSVAELSEPARLEDTTNFAIFKMMFAKDVDLPGVMASIPTSFTNQSTARGTLSDTWAKVRARSHQSEDGRGVIMLFCAKTGINVALYGATSIYSSYDKYEKGYTDYYYGVVSPNIDAMVIGGASYPEDAGYKYTKDVSRNSETGLYDVTIKKLVAQAVSSAQTTKQITAFNKEESTLNRNQASPQEHEDSQVAGTIVTTKAELNDSGVYDNTRSVDTATPVSSAIKTKEIELTKTTESTESVNQSAAIVEETSQTAGQIKSTKAEKNKHGLYNNTETVATATAVPQIEISNHTGFRTNNYYETIDVVKNKNSTDRTALPDFESGKIVKQNSVQNETKLYDEEIATITAVTRESSSRIVEFSAPETGVVVVSRNLDTPITEPTVVEDGVVHVVKNDINDYGLYDATDNTTTATEVDTGAVSFETDNGPAWVRVVENADADKVTEVAGAIVNGTMSVVPSKFPGRFTVHANNHPSSGSITGSDYEYGFFETDTNGLDLSQKQMLVISNVEYDQVRCQWLTTASRSDANDFIQGKTVTGHAPPSSPWLNVSEAGPYKTEIRGGRRAFVVSRVYVKAST